MIFLLGGLGLQDEVLPHNLHARRAGGPGGAGGGARGPVVLVQEAAGVRDVHLGTSRGLLSSGQLGPPPLVGVEPVEPHLAQYQQVHGHLTILFNYFFKIFLKIFILCQNAPGGSHR